MKSKRLYLPLSMVLVLVCSAQDAQANSTLDPYAHVKAPEPAKQKNVPIPSVDDVTTPRSYVTMPMGADKTESSGLVGSMKKTITVPGKMFKKAGSSSMALFPKSAGDTLSKGGKAIGSGFAKSASVIGSGLKSSGEAIVDGTQSVSNKLANAIPSKKSSPRKRTLNDIYIERTQQELAKVDGKEASEQMAKIKKDSKDNRTATRSAFMKLANRNKIKKADGAAPESSFYKALKEKEVLDKHPELKKQNAAPENKIASTPTTTSKSKKRFGLLKMPKLNKPTIGAGLFKKKGPEQKPQVAQSTQLKKAPVANQNQVANQTKPQAPVKQAQPAPTKTHVANLAPPAKKKRFAVPKLGMPKLKLNPFSKNKNQQPQRTCNYKVLEKPLFHKLKEKVRPTLFFESKKLSEFLGFSVKIASETLQHTGSFKFRAALNVVLNSNSNEFITISSGNFGQALAYACSIENRNCTILMPDTSAKVKINAVKKLGARVKLVDVKEKSRGDWLKYYVAEISQPVEVVSPYDDLRVIEGNSSLADDLVDYKDSFDSVVVPIGGGGLASGIVTGFERHGIKYPVIGAEPEIANDASRSLKEGKLVGFDSEPMTIADGARTLRLGEKNWSVLKSGLDSILEVTETQIEEAVKLYFDYANLKVEPTGAVSLAAVVNNKDKFQAQKPLCIVSGGNVDPELYSKLIT